MYKILILTSTNPLVVTGVDLYNDEQLKEAVTHYEEKMPSAIFGIVKGGTITYLSFEQYSTRFNMLQRCNCKNFDLMTIKKVQFYL